MLLRLFCHFFLMQLLLKIAVAIISWMVQRSKLCSCPSNVKCQFYL
jgi:hypothetical protein